ncbi:MAG: ACT domain-containing protein [Candidatus Lokiarchaeota archaeon]|nr:ACT domain-containing protein [Candidatus Lokiarchaeota archaeon]
MPSSKKKKSQISVAEATRRVIKTKPSIIDCLRYEVINFSALAQMIEPEVMEVCKKNKIKLDSIKMSLMRYTDNLIEEKRTTEQHVAKIISKSVLELKNDLVVVTVKQRGVITKVNTLFEYVEKFRFFQLIQGTEVFTILADQSEKGELLRIFSSIDIIDIIEHQSALILISPKEIIKVQGVVSYLTYLIASGQINITQIMSCHTDTIFLVDRKNALKAYSLIEEKIYFLRNLIEKT